jgi:polyphosphate glucokinase
MKILGIDVGGTGIKGAPVDTQRGRLSGERHRVPTPQPATPKAVARTVADIVAHFGWTGPIGCAVPAVVQQGVVRTAANISKTWLGKHAGELFKEATQRPVTVINDADAAGYAEMHFGAGRGHAGLVIIVTLGTGIGTALFINGHLVPNSELGHLEIHGKDAEKRAAESVRIAKELSWKEWAQRVETYLQYLQRYLWPDLLIIGGGAVKKSDKFLPHLRLSVPVVPARLGNEAGIIGAALAHEHAQRRQGQALSLG